MDIPGPSEAGPPPNETPSARESDIHRPSQAPHSQDYEVEPRPSDYIDNDFAALQLAQWGHPSRSGADLVQTIIDAAETPLYHPDDTTPEVTETWDQHLAKLLKKDAYRLAPFDTSDPYFIDIVDAIVKADTQEQITAIEVVRILHVITQYNELDPMPPSPHVPKIIKQIMLASRS